MLKLSKTQALKSFVVSKKVFEKSNIVARVGFELGTTCGFGFRSQVHYQLSQSLHTLMAVLAYTSAFCTLVWMTKRMFRLFKINLAIPDNLAFISSKSSFNRCRHSWDIGVMVQTDGQTAFQLYIVDALCSVSNYVWGVWHIRMP